MRNLGCASTSKTLYSRYKASATGELKFCGGDVERCRRALGGGIDFAVDSASRWHEGLDVVPQIIARDAGDPHHPFIQVGSYQDEAVALVVR
jgi:hypothetical protein